MKAQPGPKVSGRYFFPKAPLLWTKRTPAACVTSRKRIPELDCAKAWWVKAASSKTEPKNRLRMEEEERWDLNRILTRLLGQRALELRQLAFRMTSLGPLRRRGRIHCPKGPKRARG